MRIGLTPGEIDECQRLAVHQPASSVRPRLYGIGLGKSGTNALMSLFSGVPAAHEPEPINRAFHLGATMILVDIRRVVGGRVPRSGAEAPWPPGLGLAGAAIARVGQGRTVRVGSWNEAPASMRSTSRTGPARHPAFGHLTADGWPRPTTTRFPSGTTVTSRSPWMPCRCGSGRAQRAGSASPLPSARRPSDSPPRGLRASCREGASPDGHCIDPGEGEMP